MKYRNFFAITLSVAFLTACGGGGGSPTSTSTPTSTTPVSTTLTVTGTAATGLAIPGANITGKCKAGTGTATTQTDGSFNLLVTDGQLPCVLQVTNPADNTKLHTVVTGTGSTTTANITPLTEMATARVLGSEPNVFFDAFDANVASQKVTSANVKTAQTEIGLVLAGTVDTAALGDFMTAPLKAATQGDPTSGDAQDRLLDSLKLKLNRTQIGTIATALANNETTDAIKQTAAKMSTVRSSQPTANVAIDTSRYTLYADAVTPGEFVAKTVSNPPTWNRWADGEGQFTVLSNGQFTGSGTTDLPNAFEFKPTPTIWGWGMSFGADVKYATNLSMFATTGHLQFDIKTNKYPGKIEIGFQLNTLDNVIVDAFVQLSSGDSYGYVNDDKWHTVSIPLANLVNAAKVGLDPVNTVDLTTVVSSFVIADRFPITGKAANTTGLPNLYVDNIFISTD